MTGWGSAGASVCLCVCVSCLTQAHTHSSHYSSMSCSCRGKLNASLCVSHGHPEDVNEADSDPCPWMLPPLPFFSCPRVHTRQSLHFSSFLSFLVWLLSTFSCPFYPSEFVLLSNQLGQMKRDHFFIAPIHSHPCSLSTWYRLCIETAPAEAVAVCVQLSKSPHTHTHALTHTSTHTPTLTYTHTHTYCTRPWWFVCCCCCMCRYKRHFRWEDFHA